MQKVYSVGQINSYIKSMFDQDFVLSRVGIRGEVSNCKYHTSGHIYFSLKDAEGTIACVMFASARKGLAFRLCDGQQVVVQGSISVYERDGRYQIYAREIRLDGAGVLYERYLALKQELEDMGMFAPEYKQPIPFYARRLGVVTAPTGAAIRDIINISTRRNPWIQIILYPALVQGQGAAESVAAGIHALDELGVDVIIAGRGGGSMEDLWAFNEEIVARAIFECRTPLISAVGHETDVTIADFAADLRAPTPSAAAELAVADVRSILDHLDETGRRLQRGMKDQVQQCRRELQNYQRRVFHGSPEQKLLTQRQRLMDLEDKLQSRMSACIRERQHLLGIYAERLKGLSPLDKLSRGFAWVTDSEGKRIYSAAQTGKGEELTIYVSDGWIRAQVTDSAIRDTEQIERGQVNRSV
ncbi:MAG: exodeoxyribonuclease VII large subunit [Lachnospiraceae bacterium]|nr:exodeoxyribonuclease VII large subunit [Lachnospiraceae bacterium]